jgi:hypothetical protein
MLWICEGYDESRGPAASPPIVHAIAVWDTGTSNSVISEAIAQAYPPITKGPRSFDFDASGIDLLPFGKEIFVKKRAKLKNLPLPFHKSDCSIGVSELQKYADCRLMSCEIAQHSHTTLTNRRNIVRRLLWFLRQR